MSAPTTAVQLRDVLPFESAESRDGAAAPWLLHTPGPIPPVDDEDDDEDDDRKGGGKGGNIDPDDDEDVDDDDDDDEADKQWARHRTASFAGAGAVSCYSLVCTALREPPFAPAHDCPAAFRTADVRTNSGNPIIAF